MDKFVLIVGCYPCLSLSSPTVLSVVSYPSYPLFQDSFEVPIMEDQRKRTVKVGYICANLF